MCARRSFACLDVRVERVRVHIQLSLCGEVFAQTRAGLTRRGLSGRLRLHTEAEADGSVRVMERIELAAVTSDNSQRIEVRVTLERNTSNADEIRSGLGTGVDGPAEDGERTAVTVGIRKLLKKRVETAVLRTAELEGGYPTMAALVQGALERELDRLAIQFNGGEPFQQNIGAFRRGRPLGS